MFRALDFAGRNRAAIAGTAAGVVAGTLDYYYIPRYSRDVDEDVVQMLIHIAILATTMLVTGLVADFLRNRSVENRNTFWSRYKPLTIIFALLDIADMFLNNIFVFNKDAILISSNLTLDQFTKVCYMLSYTLAAGASGAVKGQVLDQVLALCVGREPERSPLLEAPRV